MAISSAAAATAISAGTSMMAGNKQSDAAGKAGQLASANQQQNNALLTGVNNQNQNMLAQQGQAGLDQIQQGYAAAAPYYAGAQDFLNQGYQQGRSDFNSQTEAGIRDVNNTYAGARDQIGAGYDSAIGTVAPAYANARGAINQSAGQAVNALQPYATAGGAALAQERNMLGIGDPNYRFQAADPSYQWRLQQGLGATNAQAAASGLNGSGARLIALNDYAQGAASQEYGNQFGRVAGLAGQGQQAAGNIANIYGHQGDANAGLYTGESGALNGLYTGKGNALGNSLMEQGNTLMNARAGLGAGLAGQAYQWGTGSAGLQGQQAGNQIQRGNQLAGYGLDVTGQQVGANQNYANGLVANNNAGTQARAQSYQDQGAATASGYAGVGKAVNNGLGSYAAYSTYGQPVGAGYNGLVYGAAPQSASSIQWTTPRSY